MRQRQSGGWGGHWPTRTEMPQLAPGKGKEAMEPLTDKGKRTFEALSDLFKVHPTRCAKPDYKRHAGTRHADSSHQTPGGGSGAAGAAAIKDLLLL